MMSLIMIVFVDTLGQSLILPVLPDLLASFGVNDIAASARMSGWLLFGYALMQLLFAPLIGALSDIWGRRPVILVALLGLTLDFGLMLWSPSLEWIFVARILSGILAATWVAANSCVADAVDIEHRGRIFGLLAASSAAALVFGPVFGGFLAPYGVKVPFLAALVLSAATLAFGYFALGETLPVNGQSRSVRGRLSALLSFQTSIRISVIFPGLMAIFLMQLAIQSQLTVWSYFGHQRFGWSVREIGLTMALFGSLMIMVQVFVLGRALARWGAKTTAAIGLAGGITGYVLLATAQVPALALAGLCIGSASGLCLPAVHAVLSALVNDADQGAMLGVAASAGGMAAIVGPPVMAGIFSFTAADAGFPGAGACFLLAAMALCGALAAIRAVPVQMPEPAIAGMRASDPVEGR
jgi:DHA1 family tetracycline resistance protein-like MFS transporter